MFQDADEGKHTRMKRSPQRERSGPAKTALVSVMLLLSLSPGSRGLGAAPGQKTKPFVLGETITIQSKILGEDRPLFVYTHPDYDKDDGRYPVAYVLDGEVHFRYTSGVVDLLSMREAIPWMIVVGIPNVDRIRDLSPSPIREEPRSGGAAAFRRFLREEMFPYIETRYRTEPFRLLIGHSLGGLFTIDTLLAEPGLFNAYLAVSPYLIWDEDRYLDAAVKKRARWPDHRTFLSASLGDEPSLKPDFGRLEGLLTGRDATGPESRFREFPGYDHATVYAPAVARGLLDIFPDWRLPPAAEAAGLDGIRKHYQGLTAKYGYEIRPVYFVVNMIGADFMDRGDLDEAVRILQYAVSLNPGLPFAYDTLGQCYRKKGLTEEAILNFEKALQLAPGDEQVRKALEELKRKRGPNVP